MPDITDTDLNPNSVPIKNERISNGERHDVDQLGLKGTRRIVEHEQAGGETLPEIRTEHLSIYENIFEFYAFLGLFFGIVCRYDWKRYSHFLFWLPCFLLLLANFCIGYTTLIYYQRGDIIKILEPFAMSGITLTCTLKWGVFLKYVQNLLALMFAVKKICKEINTGSRVDTVIASLQKTYSVLRAYTVALICVILFFVSIPLKFFVVDHIYYPLLPILIPFCDGTTLKGYLSATLMQSILGVYSGISTLMFGSAFLIIICNYRLLVNLIELDFQDLNDMWSPSSKTPIPVRHSFLNNIAVKLQDTQRYMKEVKQIYEVKFFIFFLVSYIGQVICLYQITEKNWLPGYTALLIVFIEMIFYCMVGTQLTAQGERMCDFIQRTNWYTFDIHSQKTLRFLLQQCQSPCNISLRSIGTLNMVTGIGVIKGIYYYYTVITEVL